MQSKIKQLIVRMFEFMLAQNSRANKMLFFFSVRVNSVVSYFFLSSDCFKIEHAELRKGMIPRWLQSKSDRRKHDLICSLLMSLPSPLRLFRQKAAVLMSYTCRIDPRWPKPLWIYTSGVSLEEQKSPRLLRRPTWSHPDRSNERQSSAITHITLQSEENEEKKNHV